MTARKRASGTKLSQGAKTNEWKFQVYIGMEVIKTVPRVIHLLSSLKIVDNQSRTKARNRMILVRVRIPLVPLIKNKTK